MNQLTVFESKEFGQVRTVTINSEPYFCLIDICKSLGLDQVSRAKARLNQDGVTTSKVIDSLGREQQANFINESNMYKLIFQSRKESAERFTEWVTSEVLPQIRKTGTYHKPMTPQEIMREQLAMIDNVSDRVTALENNMTIDYGQQRVLERLVSGVVITALGGKDTKAYKEISKKVFTECNRDIKDYFDVNSRNNIPKLKFDDACSYIKDWKPCTNTKMLINSTNYGVAYE